MKKNTIVFVLALCPLIPAASLFSYGIILAVSMIWLFVSGLLFREIVKKIAPVHSGLYIELVCLGGSSTIFYIFLQGFFPVFAVSLGLYVFISSFSYLLLTSIDYFTVRHRSFLPIIPFIPIMLGFSLLREILGFGTVSFPLPSGNLVIPVLPYFEYYGLGFWGTAGGALIMLGLFAWFVKFLNRRTSILRRNT